MRFRYLVAVPFADHGSELADLDENDARRSVRAVPRRIVSEIDFAILKNAFETMPCLIGRPRAVFRLCDGGAIEYSGFPQADDFVRAALDPVVFDRVERSRRAGMLATYRHLEELEGALRRRQVPAIDAAAAALLDAMLPFLPAILFSSQCDEPLLRVADSILDRGSLAGGRELRRAVFDSPWSLVWADVGPTASDRKSIGAAKCSEYYLATPVYEEEMPERSANDVKRLARESFGMSEHESSRLSIAHFVLQLSEELHYVWGSMVGIMSCAAAAVGDSRILEYLETGEGLG